MTGSPERARAFGASVEGEHIGGRPGNQDAFAATVGEGRGTIAVADGHGSPTCFRSEIGARIAVEIALDLTASELADLAEIDREATQVRFRRRLVDEWRARVLDHLRDHPFTDAEFATYGALGSESDLRDAIAAEPTLAYGSTLLLATADGRRVVYVQIGDGETIAVANSGDARTIFPKPAAMLSNETYSLCQPEAWQFVRVAVKERDLDDPALIVAATDGFGNAFASSEAARRRAADLRALLDESDDTASRDLSDLAAASSAASLDDATLAVLVPPARTEAPSPFAGLESPAPSGFVRTPASDDRGGEAPRILERRGGPLSAVLAGLAGILVGVAITFAAQHVAHSPQPYVGPQPSASAHRVAPAPATTVISQSPAPHGSTATGSTLDGPSDAPPPSPGADGLGAPPPSNRHHRGPIR